MTDAKRCEPPEELRGVDEEWRSVVGYEGLYSVSSEGRVRCDAAGRGRVQGRLLTANISTPKNYLRVTLSKNGQQRQRYIHHIVAAAFIGPRPTGFLALHDDGRNQNNRSSNLKYGTYVENVEDAKRHGTFKAGHVIGCQHGQAKLTDEMVRQIRQVQSPHFDTLAMRFGVSRKSIYDAYHGRTWRHV